MSFGTEFATYGYCTKSKRKRFKLKIIHYVFKMSENMWNLWLHLEKVTNRNPYEWKSKQYL